ncbi:MAG: hypothetical protein BWK78_06330 [Thiotrichaceae bacterium IS1]|nr:MAG: hypothetical protein BWK78_06330 [Thiotrichaceae bacterium IS1]
MTLEYGIYSVLQTDYICTIMQLPPEQELFTPLAKFLEPDSNALLRQVDLQQHPARLTANTIKLSNSVFNLQRALLETKISDIEVIKNYAKLNWKTVLDIVLASNFPTTYFTLAFLSEVIKSVKIEVTETDALVLYTLYQVGEGGLPGRVILLKNFYKSKLLNDVEDNKLQQSLQNLVELKCIRLEVDKVILTEHIVFNKVYD